MLIIPIKKLILKILKLKKCSAVRNFYETKTAMLKYVAIVKNIDKIAKS